MYIAIIVLGLMITGGFIARHFEKKNFNNGVCLECGGTFKHFDTDSGGGRGYSCMECHNTVWVSYNVDRIPSKKW